MRKFGKQILQGMGVLALLFGGIGLFLLFSIGPIEVAMPQADVQRRINERLPFTGDRGPLHYTITQMDLNLQTNSRVGFHGKFTASGAGQEGTGEVEGTGVIAYRNGTFWISEIRTTDIKLTRTATEGERQGLMARAGVALADRFNLRTEMHDLIKLAVERNLEQVPLHRLNENDVRQNLAKLSLKSVEVRDGNLVFILDPAMAGKQVLAWIAIGICVIFAVILLVALLASSGGGAAGLSFLFFLD